jgi:prepilin-type N-terminal cleavage/methylation domain-containing protein
MKPQCLSLPARGLTLIETLLAMVLLAILATGVISLNSQLFSGSVFARNLQLGTQLQQACMELVLAQRKNSGYASVFSCASLNGQGFTLSVADAASVQYCPAGLQCRQIEVSVAGNGITPAAATLLLVDY